MSDTEQSLGYHAACNALTPHIRRDAQLRADVAAKAAAEAMAGGPARHDPPGGPALDQPTTAAETGGSRDAGSPTAEYTAEQMKQMLVVGAEQVDRYPVYAAVHLLIFTELPGRPSFAELVDVEDINAGDDPPILAAYVRDWTALPAAPAAARLSGAGQRLHALAVSLAIGVPVDLRENVTGFGHAHARRVIEAMAIATGYGQMYAVTPTSKLDEMLAARDALTR